MYLLASESFSWVGITGCPHWNPACEKRRACHILSAPKWPSLAWIQRKLAARDKYLPASPPGEVNRPVSSRYKSTTDRTTRRKNQDILGSLFEGFFSKKTRNMPFQRRPTCAKNLGTGNDAVLTPTNAVCLPSSLPCHSKGSLGKHRKGITYIYICVCASYVPKKWQVYICAVSNYPGIKRKIGLECVFGPVSCYSPPPGCQWHVPCHGPGPG